MKQRPMTGTTWTENAPPVIIPAPYSSNQVAGRADCKGREIRSSNGGGAEQNLSPAGDGGEGGRALHGIADEAQVFEDFGGGA